eukprot:TRINITY_DN30877_c0_g1_i1.p1 TRINITY_DN30877_c0_g1~~TRINITY_DN30877_c0_g1_i1.p1  ORF type:complete len:248 (-),score=34.00 TRINITY_DN30877_c0_g1_i1:122-865(-)
MRRLGSAFWLVCKLCICHAAARILRPSANASVAAQHNGSCYSTTFGNMLNLKQCDPRWKCLPLVGRPSMSTCHESQCREGGSDEQENNICGAGCGIVSTTMILQYYGQHVDPPTVAKYMMSNGFRNDLQDRPGATCSGVSHTAICAAANQWGLQCGRSDSFETLDQWLQTGPVVAHVRPTKEGACKFTKIGHYMVLASKDEKRGGYIVSDPNSCEESNSFGTKKELSEDCELRTFIRVYRNEHSLRR